MSNLGSAGRQVAFTPRAKGALMRYACLIYFDPQKVFNQSPEAEAVLRDSEPYNAQLIANGHMVAAHALKLPQAAMTVQMRDGKMSATDGPFMETKEMLGGIVLIEARHLNEAARVASGHPIACVGSIEVRPVVDFSQPRPQL